MSMRIVYFISSHGFGHATRAAAVMNAIYTSCPAVHFDIFTETPVWLFTDSVLAPFNTFPLQTDVGLVQSNSLHENIPGTLQALEDFIPFDANLVDRLVRRLQVARPACRLVLCDIAPLGIAVARAARCAFVINRKFHLGLDLRRLQ